MLLPFGKISVYQEKECQETPRESFLDNDAAFGTGTYLLRLVEKDVVWNMLHRERTSLKGYRKISLFNLGIWLLEPNISI